jgi:hypothetical protein
VTVFPLVLDSAVSSTDSSRLSTYQLIRRDLARRSTDVRTSGGEVWTNDGEVETNDGEVWTNGGRPGGLVRSAGRWAD